LCAVLAVDEHADPGEHRVQRDQQTDGAGGDECLVGSARVQSLFERRCDHEGEQNRGEQRHDQLAWCARAELEAAARQRCEWPEGAARNRGERYDQFDFLSGG
jgi:hypothetical protein